MSPASAFILAQALAPEASWGRGRRRVSQVEVPSRLEPKGMCEREAEVTRGPKTAKGV